MSVRLSELAKELGTTKKELLERLPALGFELKKTVVNIDDPLADQVRDALKRSGTRFEPPPKKAAPSPPRPRKPARPAAEKAPAEKTPPRSEPAPAAAAASAVAPAVAAAAAPAPPPLRPIGVPPSGAFVPTISTPPGAPAPRPAMPKHPGEPRPFGRPADKHAPSGDLERRPPVAASAVSAPAAPGVRPAAEHLRPPVPESPPLSPRPGMPPPPRPGRPLVPGTEAGRPVPEMPRTTPRAPRPTSPRPTGRGGFRRSGGSAASGDRATGRSGDTLLAQPVIDVPTGPLTPVTLSEGVTIKELSEKLNLKLRDVITKLMQRGTFATINQSLDKEVAVQLSRDFGFDARIVSFEEESTLSEVATENTADLSHRPPVVTVMGHVDHGKTTLLDAIRETNVAGREAGQITQHIGAYQVEKKSRRITFLDTPGHEAFTMMRARGAKVTDIVVLVVAADDGVMPQTVEAMHHARAAGVPIIVAINKTDLPSANPDRVMQMLADQGLLAEEWGGDTVMVKISAKKRLGLDGLLDLILLVADLQDLKANAKRQASGVVLEAKLDKGRGAVATVLVQAGTLKAGDPFIAGAVYGKVRAMFDDRGEKIEDAPPATPVEVLGLQGVPRAGDAFQVVSEDWRARQIGSFRQAQMREQSLSKSARLTLDQLYKQAAEGELRELLIVLKADVQGSVEALTDMLQKLSTEKIKVRIIHSGTGAVSESDVLLASASNAIVVAFNVRPERKARDLAEGEKVDIRLHTIIYNVTDEIRAAMQGLLEPTFKENILGRVEVRQLFRVPKVGVVAGAYVQEGRVTRDSLVRVLRDNVVVYEGKLGSLRRFKEDASEVRAGYECGLSVANYPDLKEGDVLEAYKRERVQEPVPER